MEIFFPYDVLLISRTSFWSTERAIDQREVLLINLLSESTGGLISIGASFKLTGRPIINGGPLK